MVKVYFESVGWVCPGCFRRLTLSKAVEQARKRLVNGTRVEKTTPS